MARSVRKFKETVEMRGMLLTRIRSHKYFALGLLVLALLLVAFGHIWQRVHVMHLVKEVGELTSMNHELVDLTRKAETDIAALSMASRIQTYAADSLGLRPIPADHLVTLPHESKRAVPADEFATMVSSIKRVAEYLPVLTETQAAASELRPITFDSAANRRGGR